MQTIGERLEEARKKKGISIREAAEATKIRGDYLSKFESNHFDIGLTEIYTRGFLRTYANFLKVPADRLLNDYAALGRGETRPRQPSREVYGRMDITVSSASETSDRAAPPPDDAAAAEPSRPQPRYPRGSSTLPSGPDPALIFKYTKWVGVAVGAIVLVLIVKSFFGERSSPTNPVTKSTPAIQSVNERTITLVALETVTVRVAHLVGADTDGEDIYKGTLARGQSQTVAWPGPINIHANAGENLSVEYKGKRYPSGFRGAGHAQMK